MLEFVSDQNLRAKLCEHFFALKSQPLASLCQNPRDMLQFDLAGLNIDLNNHYIDLTGLDLIEQFASSVKLPKYINALLSGQIVNHSEQRPTHHTHCRHDNQSFINEMAALAQQITTHEWCGITGKSFTDIVVIGMGGSVLGPKLLLQALAPQKTNALNFHLLDNIADELIEQVLSLDLESTLFIIASKSFTTPETLLNATLCLEYATKTIAKNYAQQHVIAITSRPDAATKSLGIPAEHSLLIPEFVGGRYSIWSAVGFPVMLAFGPQYFEQFLQGAAHVDHHFQTAPAKQNIPIIMAMLSVIYSSCYKFQSHAILPYSEALRTLPAYLQQLVMESNGKSTTQQGNPVNYPTTGIVWGEKCSSAQHSFFQFLHQGTQVFSADLILPNVKNSPYPEIHAMQTRNCLAQSKAFVLGQHTEENHKVVAGNRPHSLIKLNDVTPKNLGALLAIYEHKTFVEATIWNINPFDQWGIELGKQFSKQLA